MASTYMKDDQGGTFIPASQRPDGTWRKPRRVKDGYVPQEEVPLYESKGKQFTKNKPTCPVGLTPEFYAAEKAKREAQAAKNNMIPGSTVQMVTKKKKRKNKSKAAESATESMSKLSLTSEKQNSSKQQSTDKSSKQKETKQTDTNAVKQTENATETQQDPVKRLSRLKKKIREIETLALKIKNGEIKNPDKEMLDKVSKKSQIEKEIKQLESCQ